MHIWNKPYHLRYSKNLLIDIRGSAIFFISEIVMDLTSEDLPALFLSFQKKVGNKWERWKRDQEVLWTEEKRTRDNKRIWKTRKLFLYSNHCLFCNKELYFEKTKKYPNNRSYQISETEMFTPEKKKLCKKVFCKNVKIYWLCSSSC